MTLKTPLILAALGALTLSACVDPNAYPEDPNARTKNGAIIGGMLGAMAGVAVSGDGDELKGALLGGAVGAATGAAIGSDLDRQAAELRSSLNSNISVTNMGSYLLVNMPQDLLFATDSATLSGNLTYDLRAVATSLMRYPNSTIEVVGHTDNVGEAAYNQDLSQRRAVSVANVLRESGVPNGRIAAYGRGEDQPIASNLTVVSHPGAPWMQLDLNQNRLAPNARLILRGRSFEQELDAHALAHASNRYSAVFDGDGLANAVVRAEILAHYLRLAPYGNRVRGIAFAARRYLDFLQEKTEVEVGCVSLGPERSETIIVPGSKLEKLLA